MEDARKTEAIVELTSLLNELDAFHENVTTHDNFEMMGEETLTILTENYSIRYDIRKKRWNWSRYGRKALEG